jgi:hypothetical protein
MLGKEQTVTTAHKQRAGRPQTLHGQFSVLPVLISRPSSKNHQLSYVVIEG